MRTSNHINIDGLPPFHALNKNKNNNYKVIRNNFKNIFVSDRINIDQLMDNAPSSNNNDDNNRMKEKYRHEKGRSQSLKETKNIFYVRFRKQGINANYCDNIGNSTNRGNMSNKNGIDMRDHSHNLIGIDKNKKKIVELPPIPKIHKNNTHHTIVPQDQAKYYPYIQSNNTSHYHTQNTHNTQQGTFYYNPNRLSYDSNTNHRHPTRYLFNNRKQLLLSQQLTNLMLNNITTNNRYDQPTKLKLNSSFNAQLMGTQKTLYHQNFAKKQSPKSHLNFSEFTAVTPDHFTQAKSNKMQTTMTGLPIDKFLNKLKQNKLKENSKLKQDGKIKPNSKIKENNQLHFTPWVIENQEPY